MEAELGLTLNAEYHTTDLFFYLRWTIFNVFAEFVTILHLLYGFVFCFFVFCREAYGILAVQPGTQSVPTALAVLTTGPPGKSLRTNP